MYTVRNGLSMINYNQPGLSLPQRLIQIFTGNSDQMLTVQISIISSENARVFSSKISWF